MASTSAPKITVPIAILVVVSIAEASIGINWGRESAQRLVPSQVVDLLLQNGVGRVKIFTSQFDILEAFRGSGINITSTVRYPWIVGSKDLAREWVQDRKEHLQYSKVTNINFGEYAFLKGLTNKTYIRSVLTSLRFLEEALSEQEFGYVKVGITNNDTQLKPDVTRPSECEFIDEIKPEMTEYLSILKNNGAPFWVDHIPITFNERLGYDLEFAFPDNKAFVVKDVGGVTYSNIVEWNHDCWLWAMRKLNASSDIRIAFSQIGWPTDGYPGANVANAERFYKHLLPWAKGNKGTPLRPGMPIDVNVQQLTDETKMVFTEPYTRHLGIIRSNGLPKFKIDLSGQGRDIYPTVVKGIMRMPSRWCVFNKNRDDDLEEVRKEMERACLESDCTSTLSGGSCSGLSFEQKVSYAFNMRFQFNFQDENACNSTKFGHVVDTNPSTEQCVFPVEVVRGQQMNFLTVAQYTQMLKDMKVKKVTYKNGGFRRSRPSLAVFVVWLPILLREILLFLV